MKKITMIIVLAALCLLFKANGQGNKAIDITTKGIQIGQQVPDVTINNIHNYKTTSAKLSDFKGKLLILDFWATWCSPCVAMIPKMDSLQKQFGDKIQFLSVTYQKKEEVIPFLEKLQNQRNNHYNIPFITDEKELHKLFPHIYLPHYVWIDKDGVVKAITGMGEITKIKIAHVLKNQSIELKQKTDMQIAYDKKKPLFLSNNGGDGQGIIYSSFFSKYQEGLPSTVSKGLLPNKKGYKITCINVPILKLITTAFGTTNEFYGNNRTIIEVKEPGRLNSLLSGNDYVQWQKENSFCYELIIPFNKYKMARNRMIQDLKNVLDEYNVSLVTLQKKCLVLKRTSEINKLKTNGSEPSININANQYELNNKPLNLFIKQLNATYLQDYNSPIIDKTGIDYPVDISLTCNFRDIKSINSALEKYDLKFFEEVIPLKMVVIKDQKNESILSHSESL